MNVAQMMKLPLSDVAAATLSASTSSGTSSHHRVQSLVANCYPFCDVSLPRIGKVSVASRLNTCKTPATLTMSITCDGRRTMNTFVAGNQLEMRTIGNDYWPLQLRVLFYKVPDVQAHYAEACIETVRTGNVTCFMNGLLEQSAKFEYAEIRQASVSASASFSSTASVTADCVPYYRTANSFPMVLLCAILALCFLMIAVSLLLVLHRQKARCKRKQNRGASKSGKHSGSLRFANTGGCSAPGYLKLCRPMGVSGGGGVDAPQWRLPSIAEAAVEEDASLRNAHFLVHHSPSGGGGSCRSASLVSSVVGRADDAAADAPTATAEVEDKQCTAVMGPAESSGYSSRNSSNHADFVGAPQRSAEAACGDSDRSAHLLPNHVTDRAGTDRTTAYDSAGPLQHQLPPPLQSFRSHSIGECDRNAVGDPPSTAAAAAAAARVDRSGRNVLFSPTWRHFRRVDAFGEEAASATLASDRNHVLLNNDRHLLRVGLLTTSRSS